MAKMFQALRIEVNTGRAALSSRLDATVDMLRPGGRLSVITYHSLEDRLVKCFIRSGNTGGEVEKDFYGRTQTRFKAVNNKVITPDAEEIGANPRSRSAKLRIAERTED